MASSDIAPFEASFNSLSVEHHPDVIDVHALNDSFQKSKCRMARSDFAPLANQEPGMSHLEISTSIAAGIKS